MRTVNQVAQEDQFAFGSTARCLISADLREQTIEQVKMAMNVADGIEATTIRRARSGSWSFYKAGENFRKHRWMRYLAGLEQ
ncbi:hypothetical protein [Sphingobium scionense]|uniref:Uncharacterized protein n=1 Tax=Sphingobium scionense TaxID=1404341 RepID=A0A7W6LWA1_9SPHN|nr:hypothetical protein [Sphingobium scionense]